MRSHFFLEAPAHGGTIESIVKNEVRQNRILFFWSSQKGFGGRVVRLQICENKVRKHSVLQKGLAQSSLISVFLLVCMFCFEQGDTNYADN